MRSSDDDLREDPQQTLPPRRHEAARRIVASEPGPNPSAEKPKGRRLRLGTPTRSAPSQASPEQSEMEPTLNRGFNLGGETARVNALGAAGAKPGVQRWVWFVAAGAIVLLAVALLLRPSSETSAQAIANDRLLRQYTQYLET